MKKKEKYGKMFNQLSEIGMVLVKDYSSKQKVFQALDYVADFIGDIATGRKK